ncbi:carboxypeptidase-like regulatory domain-containing protein [Thalassoroseus pseudoceratinae]|uniref:carboxypeptidase-like regulatory domain-containing protein n=1 Tax=Thalassoroseus pseudoceratinae TaxID=2713176 RepID=UPI00141E5742|nr:carboxypeptidase-like regulatory domain-containing protein [Thalassoroseus pseudoceratinae]
MKRVSCCNTRWAARLMTVTLLATMVGCGGGGRDEETVDIQGKVTFNTGPVPAESILILESKEVGVSRTATISADGTYSLTGSGALPVGTYKAAIKPPGDAESVDTSSANYDDLMNASGAPPENKEDTSFPIPPMFRSTSTTTKTVEIKSGESTYDIDFSG